MIDFWEALGRLASDSNLQNEVFTAIPLGAAYPQIGQVAIDIPPTAYASIQHLLAPKLSGGCLSLMAAGELLWGLDSPDFRTALKAMPALINVPAAVAGSTNYYIALGILIVDSGVRVNLVASPASAILPPISPLAQAEEAHLRALSNLGSFGQNSDLLCATRWSSACNVKAQFWPGHLHTPGLSKN